MESSGKMDWYCPRCCGEGEIVHNLTERPVFVICSNCGYGDAYVWCEECGVGGQISITDFNTRPMDWVCQFCGSKYHLPQNFYERPIIFTPEAFSTKPLRLLPFNKRFAKVSPAFLRNFLIYWNSYRFKVWLAYVFLFIVEVALVMAQESKRASSLVFWHSHARLVKWGLAFTILFIFPVLCSVDMVSWLAKKIIFLRNKRSCG